MKDNDFRAFLVGERQRFINYVRSLVADTAAMDAEDIVQDVLLRLIERGSATPPLDNVAAYVYRSLRNRVIDTVRTRKSDVSLDVEVPDSDTSFIDFLQGATPSAMELVQTEQGRRQLFDALDQLSAIEREVIVSHEFEGTPFKELSRRLNVPQNTLLSHKARGLAKLKEILDQDTEE